MTEQVVPEHPGPETSISEQPVPDASVTYEAYSYGSAPAEPVPVAAVRADVGAQAPDPPQPTSERKHPLWMWIGCAALSLAVVVWCVLNRAVGVEWRNDRLPLVASGETWTYDGVSLKLDNMSAGDEITVPGEDPIRASDGAVFVAVAIDYTLAHPDDGSSCGLSLLGRDRSWPPTSKVPIADVVGDDGVTSDCSSISLSGAMASEGTMGALFEIPAGALDEIRGVSVTVSRYNFDKAGWNISDIFTTPYGSALLEGKPES